VTKHFSVAEFTRSDVAVRKGLDNSLPPDLEPAATLALEMMERIREHLSLRAGRDVPISISSGYRAPAVNLAVGSSSTSDHPKATACDFTAPSFGTPIEVCRALAPSVSLLGIGQLIHEFGQWVHVSTRMPDKPVNRVITISHTGTYPGIVTA
jgi:uncharacterized protein YcbK (DUF882 family)